MEVKIPFQDGENEIIYGEETVSDFLAKTGVIDNLEGRLEHINEEPDIKELLATRIEADIQQYLSEIEGVWGDDAVIVKVKNDDAYVVWNDHWMPTIDFYQLVFKNGGVVRPKDFETY